MAIQPVNIDTAHGFNHAYPYTDFHEMNLDWLLKTYKSLVDKLNDTISWINQHEVDYEEAMSRLQAVENEIYGFEAQVNARFEALSEQFAAEFAQQKAELDAALAAQQAQVDAAILQMQQKLDREIASFEQRYQDLKSEVEAAINEMLGTINNAISNLQNILEANNQYVFQYVEYRLDEFINSLPDHTTVYVYNPYRGEVTDLQTAINDIYSVACIWGLTAEQYDSLGLTAEEYDNLELSAQEYDTRGYQLLYKDPNYYMLSPFSGNYEKVKDVVMDLAHLHMGGVTAEEYDAFELTAEEYDNKELTAFTYDWYADEVLP